MTLTVTNPINSKKDFLADCKNWCDNFQTENKVMIAYVRRGPRPVRNVFIQSEDGTVAATKRGRRKPQGVVAAYRGQDGTVRIGWSLCRKSETYDNKVGLRYALERAIPLNVVREMLKELTTFEAVRVLSDRRIVAGLDWRRSGMVDHNFEDEDAGCSTKGVRLSERARLATFRRLMGEGNDHLYFSPPQSVRKTLSMFIKKVEKL
jgi:hypothetical protein